MPTPTVRLLSPTEDAHLVPYIAAIHAACISHDQMIATFLPPLSNEKLLAYWREKIADTTAGTRFIVILLNESEPGTVAKGPELMGVVSLSMAQTETLARNAVVEKLMVSPKYRQKGAARAMMEFLETEALSRRRTLLLLDTEVGSAAEKVYPRLGYIEIGRIPKYCISPSGDMKDELFFYKQLS
ncbi:acyl-CoA N-acyltransferase [Xylariaceae sp. FL1651]|nr:acyl-CoA N-acyltransferase [Xylariaceae sp. FL1651]